MYCNDIRRIIKSIFFFTVVLGTCWGFGCSWLEIPGNVIYITSQPNHSARNPSSYSKRSESCLGRLRRTRRDREEGEGLTYGEEDALNVERTMQVNTERKRVQTAGVYLSTHQRDRVHLPLHHHAIIGRVLLNVSICTHHHVRLLCVEVNGVFFHRCTWTNRAAF